MPGRSDLPQQTINLDKEWRQRQAKRWVGVGLMAFAVIVAIAHVFEHAGSLRLMSPAASDLFIGWPTAAMIFVFGAILYGRD